MKDLEKIDLLAKTDVVDRESYQMDVTDAFSDFNDAVRYHGTPAMMQQLELLHKLTFETVAKAFNQQQLKECTENFLEKVKDLSYFNGYLDVTIESSNHIYDVWMDTVFDLQADWVFNGVFEHDENTHTLTVNVGSYRNGVVGLERTLRKRN